MATVQEAIKRLIYQFTSTGADKVAADLKAVNQGQAAVTATAQTTERAALSLDRAFGGLERRFVEGVRAQQDYERIQRQVNAAVAQNPALADRANSLLAAAALHYGQAGVSARAFAAATSTVNAQLVALSAGAGPATTFLAGLGPVGFAAAVGLGAATVAIHSLSDGAHDLAQRAEDLKRFSDATGLTTDQVQALTLQAQKFNISGDDAKNAIAHFTAQFNALRQGSGDLLTEVRRVDAGLADQMQQATDTGAALNLLGKALAETDNVFQRNALIRAAAGRGGIGAVNFLTGLNVDQLTQSARDAGGVIDHDLIEKVDDLNNKIKDTTARAKQNFEQVFSLEFLQAEKNAADQMLRLSEIARDFKMSNDLAILAGKARDSSFVPSWISSLLTMLPVIKNLQSGGIAPLPAGAQAMSQNEFNTRFDMVEQSNAKAKAATSDGRGKTLEAQIADYRLLTNVLGDLASVEDKVKLAELEFTKASLMLSDASAKKLEALKAEFLARAEYQALLEQKPEAGYQRQLDLLKQIMGQYQGLTAQEALRINDLDEQYRLISASSNVDRLSVQRELDFNKALREGLDPMAARLIAEKEFRNAQERVNQSVEDQVRSLQQQTDLIKARANGNEAEVASAQAYENAIRAGADATQAAALAAATLDNYLARAAANCVAIESAFTKFGGDPNIGPTVFGGNEQFNFGSSKVPLQSGQNPPNTMGKTLGGFGSNVNFDQLNQLYGEGGYSTYANYVTNFKGSGFAGTNVELNQQGKNFFESNALAAQLVGGADPNELLKQLLGAPTGSPGFGFAGFNVGPTPGTSFLDAVTKFQTILDLEKRAGISPQQTINEITSGKIGQGVPATQLLQALDELRQQVQQNSEATKANTAALGVSSIYSSGHAAIGYYNYGSGGSVDLSAAGMQPANTNIPQLADGGVIPPGMVAYVGEHGPNPRLLRAGNEPVMVTPNDVSRAARRATVVNVVNNFPAAAASESRRSIRQFSQSMAQRLRASA